MSDLSRTARSASLAYRAAEYFGVEDQPRMSIPITNPKGVLIVNRTGDRVRLLLYREWPQVHGEHVLLTDVQRAKLIAGLTDA